MKRTEQTVLAIFAVAVILTTGIQLGLVSQQYGYAEIGTPGMMIYPLVRGMIPMLVWVEMTP